MNAASAVQCDVLVVGSGAAGLATAVTARVLGLDVLVVEKAPVFGGTTAWSGGWLWIPQSPPAVRAGITDSISAARTYLQAELGADFDAARIDAFLTNGPRMVEFFENETAVRFLSGTAPDFHADLPGAAVGRPICAEPFDGRELGGLIDKLRLPLAEVSLRGMAIAAGSDLRHFMNATRVPASAWYAARRVARYALDVLRYGRGMHLVNGNALAARLLKSASDRGVRLWTESRARDLIVANGAVTGAWIETTQGRIAVSTRRGVVLAAGGFPNDVARRRRWFPHTPTGNEHWSAAPAANTGDGLALAEDAGAVVPSLPNAGAWVAVSMVRRRDGTNGVFPHVIDRARPGVIAVTRRGRRFTNEANSYHDFMLAIFRATEPGDDVAAWLICDHACLRRYGLGFAKPFPFPVAPYLRSGYLLRGETPAALANAAGIDAPAFAETIDAYNVAAREGRDPAFGRGSTPFNRFGGDPAHQPNPCVAPIEQGPFYAVKVLPGSLGTFAGVKTDADARALDHGGEPIAGLYAVGNDMASIMAGRYPSGGITLGPAMTFGWLAARHLAGDVDPPTAPSEANAIAAASH